jgi:hypothetical protein
MKRDKIRFSDYAASQETINKYKMAILSLYKSLYEMRPLSLDVVPESIVSVSFLRNIFVHAL